MRKLHLLADEVKSEVWEKYGKLVASLALLEWFLEEAILLIILGRKFDPAEKADQILQKHISGSKFVWKIKIVEEFDLLSKSLKDKLDQVRIRRNIFVHGIGLKINGDYYLQDRKGVREIFEPENILGFTDFIENTGGQLVDEFEKAGFQLSSPENIQNQ